MAASPSRQFLARARIGILCLGLLALASPLDAADQRLTVQVPTPVAQGKLAPLGRVHATNQLRLAFCLPLRNTNELTQLLAAIYTPGSPQFHQYLKPAEFAARFGPAPEDYAALEHFALKSGLAITRTHSNRVLLDVTGQAADIERALHVRLNWFQHPTEPRKFFATDTRPAVDAALPPFQVIGLDNFSRPHPNYQWRGAVPDAVAHGGSGPYGTFMGDDFRRAYVPGTSLTGAGQNVGLLEFDGFYDSDIINYAQTIGLTNALPQRIVVPVDGGVSWIGLGAGEVVLDIDMVLSMSPGVGKIYVYEAPNDDIYWADMLSQMANDNFAQQLSCSWSAGGPVAVSEEFFLQMAAQGQTFFNATGDSDAFVRAVPFPSASPNVVEVGGTFLGTDTSGNYAGESVWNRNDGNGSSGGICPPVAVPPWQLGLDTAANGGSTVWRNVPDVTLTADDVYTYCFGQGAAVGGTSCSAPLWAGLTALINERAAQLGQPPVGFLNPALYALGRGANYAATFHDITVGNNFNGYSRSNFVAAPGFDLCTGWGTPNGTNLINALTTPDFLGVLPPAIFSSSGFVGGPFPQNHWTFALTNAGAASLNWSLGNAPTWLTVSASGGVLSGHAATNIFLQLRRPEALPTGSYLAVLPVTNQALSRVQIVAVRLDIGQSLVQNGGFETGDFTGWTLAGDTVTNNLVFNIVATDFDFPGLAHSGNCGAHLGQIGFAATLSQTLATTPGQRYLISWWLDNLRSGTGQLFQASWAGTNFVNLTNPPVFAWTNFLFVFTASDAITTLRFAAENDTNYFGLDDVSVAPVPPVAFAGVSSRAGGFQLGWNSLAGLNYQIQWKTNLAQSGWSTLSTVAAVANFTAFADTNSASEASQRYYRLVLMP